MTACNLAGLAALAVVLALFKTADAIPRPPASAAPSAPAGPAGPGVDASAGTFALRPPPPPSAQPSSAYSGGAPAAGLAQHEPPVLLAAALSDNESRTDDGDGGGGRGEEESAFQYHYEPVREYPDHWGQPPLWGSMDMRPLPGGYGQGSSTLARWIQNHLDADAAGAAGAADAVAAAADAAADGDTVVVDDSGATNKLAEHPVTGARWRVARDAARMAAQLQQRRAAHSAAETEQGTTVFDKTFDDVVEDDSYDSYVEIIDGPPAGYVGGRGGVLEGHRLPAASTSRGAGGHELLPVVSPRAGDQDGDDDFWALGDYVLVELPRPLACYQARAIDTNYPQCHGYEAAGYVCVGGDCAAADPGGDRDLCAERAPEGWVVDPTSGRCVEPDGPAPTAY